MVGIQSHLIVGDQIPRNGFTVVWPKEFSGCMPKLPQFIWFHFIQGILKVNVAQIHHAIELGAVLDQGEVEWFTRIEDGGMLCKVTIVRVV